LDPIFLEKFLEANMRMKDRLFGALIALLVSSFCTAVGPFIVVVFLRGHQWELVYLYKSFFYWGGAVIMSACGVGFTVGIRQFASFLDQMFFRSQRVEMQKALFAWSLTFGIGLLGYFYYSCVAAVN
jgi:hypothetical protein